MLDEAKMYKRALAGFEKALGPEHTTTLLARNNLGSLYWEQRKLKVHGLTLDLFVTSHITRDRYASRQCARKGGDEGSGQKVWCTS